MFAKISSVVCLFRVPFLNALFEYPGVASGSERRTVFVSRFIFGQSFILLLAVPLKSRTIRAFRDETGRDFTTATRNRPNGRETAGTRDYQNDVAEDGC